MTKNNTQTKLWTILGFLMSLSVILIVLSGLSGQVWIADVDGINQSAEQVLTSIKDSDWDKLNTLIDGNSDLIPQIGDENTAENLIWHAYTQSLQWEIDDTFQLQGACVTKSTAITCLDISSLADQITDILSESADHTDLNSALISAAEQVLDEDIPLMQRKISMSFVRKDDDWKLVPNNALLSLLSAFTAS